MARFNKVNEVKVARELGEILTGFDSSMKFRQQLTALQSRKVKDLNQKKISESEFNLFNLKARRLKRFF